MAKALFFLLALFCRFGSRLLLLLWLCLLLSRLVWLLLFWEWVEVRVLENLSESPGVRAALCHFIERLVSLLKHLPLLFEFPHLVLFLLNLLLQLIFTLQETSMSLIQFSVHFHW